MALGVIEVIVEAVLALDRHMPETITVVHLTLAMPSRVSSIVYW